MNKWDSRFMDMAKLVSGWSSCYKPNRQVGAVIVRDKRILTTGYNGAPQGIPSCKERCECMRENLGIASGTRQEMCYAVHAEQNAIVQHKTRRLRPRIPRRIQSAIIEFRRRRDRQIQRFGIKPIDNSTTERQVNYKSTVRHCPDRSNTAASIADENSSAILHNKRTKS